MLLLGAIATCIALTRDASAQPDPGAMLGIITYPLSKAIEGIERIGRRPQLRRPAKSRSRSTTAARSRPAVSASAAVPAGAAANTAVSTAAEATTATGEVARPTAPVATATLPSQRGARASGPPPQPARPQYRLGMAGPLAWPNAYEDIIGFTFWPKEYGERVRAHGIGDVLFTIFAPAVLTARNRADTAPSRTVAVASASSPGPCGGNAQSPPDWLTGQIERSIKLTPAQSITLDQLKLTAGEALKSIKSTCRDETALAPAERLRAMQTTLWAVHDAVIRVRAPLAKFYDSLTDDQKQKFSLPAAEADPRTMATAGAAMTIDDYARMCGMPKMDDGGMEQIEKNLRPDQAQRASLDTLQTKSAEMGRFLMASCLQPMRQTPVERLDSAADRLTAVIFATSTISFALNDLYGQLSEEQKARMGSFAR